MRRITESSMGRLLASLSLVVLVACGSASAHEIKLKALKIIHPWVHETEGQQAALHVKINNTGAANDRLLRATSPLAGKVAILDADGKETKGLAIAGRGEVAIQSGGPQIVLRGLKKPLRAYDSFDLILVFEKAGTVKLEVLVEEAAAPDKPKKVE
jgi:copper(I)-binding protein